MTGTRYPHVFRPRSHRYALEPRQMYDGAALTEANSHHADPSDAGHDTSAFRSAATEQPGHAAALAAPRIELAAAAGGMGVTTSATGLNVAEPSTLNAAGADRGTLSGWTIDGSGTVTVTATVSDTAKGSLVTGTPATTVTGGYRFTGSVADATAWLNQLTFVAADVELGNTAARTTIDVNVTDSASHSGSHSLDVTITPSNDPVSVADATKTVDEVGANGGPSVTVIGTETLVAIDPEVAAGTQTPEQIVYSVTDLPRYGYLALDGNRLGAGSVFTQQDVIDGRLTYVHTATGADQDTADGFVARVNDGATPTDRSATVKVTLEIHAINQAPTIGGTGIVYEGQPSNAVDTGNVGKYIVADSGGDPQDTALRITITGLPQHGTLYFNGTAVTVGQSFDYADRNRLTYANDGVDGVTQDSFGVRVTDMGGGTGVPASTDGTIVLDVHAVDDDPVLDPTSSLHAGVTPGGNGSAGAYSVVLTPTMIGATDVDSPDQNISFVTSQQGLTHGYLLLNGERLLDGATFTMDDIRHGRVQYVQVSGAATGQQDTFHFQVVDNTTALRWNPDGSTFTRIGGEYTGGTPTDTLRDFTFVIDLAATAAGNGGSFPNHDVTTVEHGSTYAGVDPSGAAIGTVSEGGSIVLHGTTTNGQPTDFTKMPGLSYTAQGVDPSQVVYTFLGFTSDGAGTGHAGTLQKQVGTAWVDIATYGTFTQADLDAGRIRFQHDGDSEDFHTTANFAVSAGLVTAVNGQPTMDSWKPSFDIYVTPVNDLPVVTGSSNTVIAEGDIAYITKGQLGITDPDDATSEPWLENSPTLPNGDPNYAYNNDATGAKALKFLITSLPAGGKLQYSTDGGHTWLDVTANTLLDASIITGDKTTTGLRFVSNGSEVRSTSFTVAAQDRWGDRSLNDGTVGIQITNVNDAPQIARDPTQADPAVPSDSPNNIGGAPANNPLTVVEGGFGRITDALLQAYDPDSSARQVQYTITGGPSHGRIAYSTDGVNFHFLGVGSSFTQADVTAGRIYYLNDGTEPTGTAYPGTPDDRFTFTVSDGDKEQAGNQFWIYTSPANDAPTVTAPNGPIDLDSADPRYNPVPGFTVGDPDLATLGPGETDYLQVTVRLLHADGSAFSAAEYAAAGGVSIGYASGGGATVGAGHNGSNDYLVLSGTRAQVNAALAGLTVTFGSDRDAIYQVQVIADDRLRDNTGALSGGANGGSVNQSTTPGTGTPTTAVDATNYDWYRDAVPDKNGNLGAATVIVRASSVNEPGTLGGPSGATVYEDQATPIGGAFVVSDPESAAFDTPVTIRLSVPSGVLGIGGNGAQTSATAAAAGSRAVTISGDNTGTLVLTGRASDIQALLNDPTLGLTYRTAANVNHDTNGAAPGDVTLTVHFDDTGSVIGGDVGNGSVSNNPADIQVAIDIVPVNDPPSVAVGTGTVYLNGSTPVGGFVIGDVDYTDGGGIAAGEKDFLQVTVRIADANGNPLPRSAYGDIVLGSSAAGTSGATVDGTYSGTDSALVIRGTRQQVNDYLAGLQVSIGGTLTNVDQVYHVEVIADDRLRDVTTGALDGSGAANGGQNAAAAGGVQAVPTTVVDPYAKVPTGLTQNVALGFRVVFPSSINNPTAIGVTGPNVADESAAGLFTLGNVRLSDPDAGDAPVTATITLPSGFNVHDVAGATTISGHFGGATYTFGTDAQGRSTITITGTIGDVEATINAVGVKLPPAAAGDNNGMWNGTFQVLISVNDNGNHGDRPNRQTLDDDAAANAGADPTTIGDEYGYADGEGGTSNALVTTRIIDVTVNSRTQVSEAGLVDHNGSDGVDGAQSFALLNNLASVTLGSPTDGAGHYITLTAAQLNDIAHVDLADRSFTTANGTLVVTGYVPGADGGHGTLLYHYSLNGPVTQSAASSVESIAFSTRDSAGVTDNGKIDVTIVNDTPTARPDTADIDEDGPSIGGNVVTGGPGADRVGADANPTPVTGVAVGTVSGPLSGHVGTGVVGNYGTLTLNADGSYTYVLDNSKPVVNALKDGQFLTETYSYTIVDGDGDTSTTTLTITIHGHTDGTPSVTPHDGNGAGNGPGSAGHTTVWESGLTPDGPAGQSNRATDTIAISAPDGLTSVTVGGVTLTTAQLAALSSGTPVTVITPHGTLQLTGFTPTSTMGGAVLEGTLTYTYTLGGAIGQGGAGHSLDTIALRVDDAGGGSANGSLVVDIVNDTPTARPDTADIDEDGPSIGGNVVTGGPGADRVGADANPTPVTGVVAGNVAGPLSDHVGAGVVGNYGTLTLNADGSYSYVLDNANATVNALKDGQFLTETYSYTIVDGDGDTSTTTLTITIHGHTDGTPSVTPHDGNGAGNGTETTGHTTVWESGLTPDGPAGQSHRSTDTIAISAPDGLSSITVGGVTLTTAQLAALSNGTPVSVVTPRGTLLLTGFTPTSTMGGAVLEGTLTYTYTLGGSVNQPGVDHSTDTIALTVNDAGGGSANGNLVVNIVNDRPTARPDTADIDEDGPSIGGNVVTGGPGADRVGADANPTPVTGVVAGNVAGPLSGHVGTGVVGNYGTLTLNADGSYSYVLDNANPTVNALKDGQSLTETYSYTIVDGDGDTSTTTLTITIHGHTDGGPSVTPHPGNGTNTGGDATVWESGLTPDGPTGESRTASDTITISTPDGLSSVTVGGVTLTTAQLAALSNGTPVSVVTPRGTLLLTGFTPTSVVGGSVLEGTLSYTYTLDGAIHQPGVDHSTDTIALTVNDAGGGSANGNLVVNIVNDRPTARPDTADIDEDGPSIGGNVVTGGPGADRVGADANPTSVTGVVAGNVSGPLSGHVGSGVIGNYGTLTLNADGSYSYVLDNANPTVNALKDGQSLTETYSYTIVDGDGDTSTTTLTITIHGRTDGTPSIQPVDGNGAANAHATVVEAGLAEHDGSQSTGGNILITADDGLAGIVVGGVTLDLAQLTTLASGQPVTVRTPDGTLVLTGFQPTASTGGVPTAGTLSYTYTLDHAVPRAGGGTDTIALSVLDAGGGSSTGSLVVDIVDDTPTARPDTATVHEDGAPVSGNVVTGGPGADRIGADTNATPVAGVVHGGASGPLHGNVGSGVAGDYGTLTLNADGSYTYVLDNANPKVNALKDGDTLTETYSYTIVDGDGDTSTTTLTITIVGHTDGAPAIVPHDGNGPGEGRDTTGHTTVWESGLTPDGPSGQPRSASDTIVISAPDRLASVTIGGVTLTPAQLDALGKGSPVTVVTGQGTLLLTGFTPTATVGGVAVEGTLSYTYTLGGAVAQPGADHSTDTIALSVTDAGGGRATGNLVVDIVNDRPLAHDDAASIDRDAAQGSTSGNVFTGTGASHDGADRIGADGPGKGGPVTAVSSDNLGHAGAIGGPSQGQYGTLTLHADGSYTYDVDPRNPKVASLDASRTLSEVFVYTITDADGDTSQARLVITIRGATPPIQARWGDQIFPIAYQHPDRDIRQGYEPGLFVLPAVDGVQRDTQRWQLGRFIVGAGHQADLAAIAPDPDNAQFVLNDGVAFSRQLLVEVRSQSRVALRDAGLGSRVLWDDFTPFAPNRIAETQRHDEGTRHTAEKPAHHAVKLPKPDAVPQGAPSLSARLASLAHGAPAPVATSKPTHH